MSGFGIQKLSISAIDPEEKNEADFQVVSFWIPNPDLHRSIPPLQWHAHPELRHYANSVGRNALALRPHMVALSLTCS